MLLVLSEATTEPATSSAARDNTEITEAARLAGCRVYYIPKNFNECETAENALWHVPEQLVPTPAVWIGFIPTPERDEAVFDAARAKNVFLVNTPEQHLNALEFDRSYSRLEGLTPETVILERPDAWRQVSGQLGFPVFVRGSVRSRKAAGWTACVAEDEKELRGLVSHLFSLPYRSRGRVLVRRLAKLRHTRRSEEGFPLGREYRVFLLNGTVVGLGYYWDGDDPMRELSASEEESVRRLAVEASARVGTPFLCVDIAQEESGDWIIIEVGDAQFAGTGQIPHLPLWQAIFRTITATQE